MVSWLEAKEMSRVSDYVFDKEVFETDGCSITSIGGSKWLLRTVNETE